MTSCLEDVVRTGSTVKLVATNSTVGQVVTFVLEGQGRIPVPGVR